jgi:hypothetical protein
MDTLLERLSDNARTMGAVNAVQDASGGTWRWLTWAELEADVNRLCGSLALTRGDRLEWGAPAGALRLAVDLALQHLGVVGVAGGEPLPASQIEAWLAGREEPGRLVRLRAELRPRDPAVERDGQVVDHAGVDAVAKRVAALLGVGSPASVLVAATPAIEQAIGWGCVWSGSTLLCGGPELLPTLHPTVWVTSSDLVRMNAPPPSRAGPLGAVVRGYGRTSERLGRRLQKVLVLGGVPAEAETYRGRGIEVAPWTG